jgi:hypothetical protein
MNKKCVCLPKRKCFYCETWETWDQLNAEQKAAGEKLARAMSVRPVDRDNLRAAIQTMSKLNLDIKSIPLEMF